ncbi:hypothetical protein ABPG77_003809 [Micractinium sp. CCAP 211/92]
MADLACLQRRVDELIALAAILGPQAIAALEPAELLVAVAEGAFDASSTGHLAGAAIRLSIALLLPAAGGACDAGQQALLHLELPANYPATEAARVEALTCALLGRLALLRLDHMHARAAYSRTLRRWAGELGLGGRLLFCSGGGGCNGRGPAGSGGGGGGGGAAPIILILLEGPASDVKEFVVRLRTRNVDVDSRGRPCRERMMSILAQADLPSSKASGGSSGGSTGGGSGSSSSGVASAGAISFDGHFAEQEISVPELAALLQRCGLAERWTAATYKGLPIPLPKA